MKMKILLSSLFILTTHTACELFQRSKCEWYLVPEVKHKDLVEPGWVALCARNYKLGKEKCYLKAKLDFAEYIYGKPFRYTSMKTKDEGFPREVLSVELCSPD